MLSSLSSSSSLTSSSSSSPKDVCFASGLSQRTSCERVKKIRMQKKIRPLTWNSRCEIWLSVVLRSVIQAQITDNRSATRNLLEDCEYVKLTLSTTLGFTKLLHYHHHPRTPPRTHTQTHTHTNSLSLSLSERHMHNIDRRGIHTFPLQLFKGTIRLPAAHAIV